MRRRISTAALAGAGLRVAAGCISIALTNVAGANRYNLVGNPFPFAVDWSLVRVRIDGGRRDADAERRLGRRLCQQRHLDLERLALRRL